MKYSNNYCLNTTSNQLGISFITITSEDLWLPNKAKYNYFAYHKNYVPECSKLNDTIVVIKTWQQKGRIIVKYREATYILGDF